MNRCSLRMCIHIYIHIYIYIYIYICSLHHSTLVEFWDQKSHKLAPMNKWMYTYLSLCVCVCVCASCAYVNTYVHTYILTSVYIYWSIESQVFISGVSHGDEIHDSPLCVYTSYIHARFMHALYTYMSVDVLNLISDMETSIIVVCCFVSAYFFLNTHFWSRGWQTMSRACSCACLLGVFVFLPIHTIWSWRLQWASPYVLIFGIVFGLCFFFFWNIHLCVGDGN